MSKLMPSGADVVVQQLLAQEVKWVSTLCGNGLNPFYDACRRAGVRVVDTHNEQAAAYIADAYARLTSRLAVCAVSSGIAHNNALTGLANAYFDSAPVLLITGASAGYGSNRGVFQEFDQVALAAPICKFSAAVGQVEELTALLREAISCALGGRPGPVHLTIPEDILKAEVPGMLRISKVAASRPGRASSSEVASAARMIEESMRPILIVGTGAFRSGAQSALARFSDRYGVPFVVPIWDRGIVETPHPNFMGVVGAASGEPRLLEDADLVILAGAEVDYRCGFLAPPKVRPEASLIGVGCGADRLAKGKRANMSLAGDVAMILDQLSEASQAHPSGHADWIRLCRTRLTEFRRPWLGGPVHRKIRTGRDIVDAIRPLLSDDVLFLIDGGNIGQWVHMALADHYPGRWLTCGASAVVGWGLPGALGARLEYPDRPILLLSGDGAFGFTTTELESAVRQKLSFVTVVANDSAWGIVVCGQRDAWSGRTMASQTSEIRFDKVANDLGAKGLRVRDTRDLAAAIRAGFKRRIPTVIDVPIRICSPQDSRRRRHSKTDS